MFVNVAVMLKKMKFIPCIRTITLTLWADKHKHQFDHLFLRRWRNFKHTL